jgi:dihydroorotase
MDQITITRPDDWHLHLRDAEAMRSVLPDSAHRFARAVVMPNLKPPVTTTEAAIAYRDRIFGALPTNASFTPLMTLYLTEATTAREIAKARSSGAVFAVKYYPAGVTTHSELGVSDVSRCFAALEAMQEHEMPLLVHGEVADPLVDVFDREKVFLDRVLDPLVRRFSSLRIVLEHVTTREGIEFVEDAPRRVAATITAHHLLLNRNALFQGGLRPHAYCLPILKRERDREKLIEAATSGNPKFFLGSDSAPHARSAKEAACGCAGIYTAHAGIELYAEAFDTADSLDKLEPFASLFGPDFHRLPRNHGSIKLSRESWTVPQSLPFGAEELVPFRAGERVRWKLTP